ncbi:hypothetical protein P3W33_14010 [Luteibacter sp. PPL552]
METTYRAGQAAVAETCRFVLVTFVLVLITHAMAYLTHEYAHSVAAWSLGWMATPFGIDYGRPTLYNLVFLGDVSDNVQYDPIFASGHGGQAACIALAGPFIGNGLLYVALVGIASRRVVASRRYPTMILYWLCLMCAGNVWSYVPIRAITTHADIALAARGLGWSTWALFPELMAVSAVITWHFFRRLFPAVYPVIAGDSPWSPAVLVAVTGFWYFVFFGSGGMDGSYGLVTQVLSILSGYVLFPLCVAYLSWVTGHTRR